MNKSPHHLVLRHLICDDPSLRGCEMLTPLLCRLPCPSCCFLPYDTWQMTSQSPCHHFQWALKPCNPGPGLGKWDELCIWKVRWGFVEGCGNGMLCAGRRGVFCWWKLRCNFTPAIVLLDACCLTKAHLEFWCFVQARTVPFSSC